MAGCTFLPELFPATFFYKITVSKLQVPAHHVLDLFCLKIMDRGVFFSNVSPASGVTLKSLEFMRREIGRRCGTSVVTDLKPKVT